MRGNTRSRSRRAGTQRKSKGAGTQSTEEKMQTEEQGQGRAQKQAEARRQTQEETPGHLDGGDRRGLGVCCRVAAHAVCCKHRDTPREYEHRAQKKFNTEAHEHSRIRRRTQEETPGRRRLAGTGTERPRRCARSAPQTPAGLGRRASRRRRVPGTRPVAPAPRGRGRSRWCRRTRGAGSSARARLLPKRMKSKDR